MTVLLVLVAVLLGAVAQEQKEVTRKYPDGTLREKYTITVNSRGEIVRVGKFFSRHANGKKKAWGAYQNDERHGKWRFYYDNEEKRASGRYKNGMRIGRWDFWDVNGKPDPGPSGVYVISASAGERGSRLNDVRQGRWRFFRSDGSLKIEGHYQYGRPDGVWKLFHPDGSLDPALVSGHYRDGMRIGPLLEEGRTVTSSRIDDLRSCLTAPPFPGFEQDKLAGIASDLKEWSFLDKKMDGGLSRKLIDHGQALIPLLLERLRETDLGSEEEVRTSARIVRCLLGPLHNGWSFAWREGVSEEDQAVNRFSILRWHALFELVREDPAFYSLRLRLAGLPEETPDEANPLFEPKPAMLRPRASGLFAGRLAPARPTRAGDRALQWALDWLVRHQQPDGRWSAGGFGAMCRSNLCDGEGDRDRDVDVTSLALLALLGDPDQKRREGHADALARGVGWLVSSQNPETGAWDSAFTYRDPETGKMVRARSSQAMHGTALATLALAEATVLYSVGGALPRALKKAVEYGRMSRNPYKAWGYAYPPDGSNNMAVTGWMIMAQIAASEAGLPVDQRLMSDVRSFMDEMTDSDTLRTGYNQRGSYTAREEGLHARWPGEKSEETTALAMLCRLLMGESGDRSRALRGGSDLLRKLPPHWSVEEGTIDYRYWFFGTQSLSLIGGQAWGKWSEKMLNAVVKTQRQEGCEQGSWDPQFDPWGHRGGRVYATAILALTLEAPTRYSSEGL